MDQQSRAVKKTIKTHSDSSRTLPVIKEELTRGKRIINESKTNCHKEIEGEAKLFVLKNQLMSLKDIYE